ncbi:MAG: hypothetical protein BWK79_06030 [Beggiatoa sp. IS2]|nr:MAG: hypothetical protein BWK79_06030 [Beggiatoa sp. IS2]
MRKNYYEWLGIRPDANVAEIKAAAYKLAQKYNPKKYPGNPKVLAHFKQIKIIYRTLTDSQKRAKYDALLQKQNIPVPKVKLPENSVDTPVVPILLAPTLITISKSKDLLEPEKTVYTAHVHWFIYGRPLLLIGFLIYLLFGNPGIINDYADRIDYLQNKLAQIVMTLHGLLVISGCWFIYAILVKLTTKLTVTTRQTIATVGLISRKTIQLNHGKFENIFIDQGLLGIILGFGSVRVRGVGGINFKVHYIAFPKHFEEHLMRTLRTKAYREMRKS